MSPTVFREGPYRFFFFSREEARCHIHIRAGEREAKLWIEPDVELAENSGFNSSEIGIIKKLVEEHRDEIQAAWNRHFTSGSK